MDKMTEITIKKGGENVRVKCPQHVVNMLSCEVTDPGLKEIVCNNLLRVHANEEQQSSSMTHVNEEKVCANTSTSTSADCSVSKWNTVSEKLLLETFKEQEESKSLKNCRNKWKVISDSVNVYGYHFSAEQCRLKIKTLKEKFERNKKKNSKSGESPASDDVKQLDDIFTTCPDMNPVFVLDSTECGQGDRCNYAEKQETESAKRPFTEDSSGEGSVSDAGVDTVKEKEKRPRRSVDVMREFLGDAMDKREEAAERRHKEKLDAIHSLIGVLRDSLKKE